MVDDIGTTKTKTRDEVDLCQRDAKANDPGTKSQAETEPMAHGGGVVQWAADSHITVIGHGSQENTFRTHKCNKKVKLYHTVGEGDAVTQGPEAEQKLGYSHRDVPGLQKRQVSQEEVHRLLQWPVLLHQ